MQSSRATFAAAALALAAVATPASALAGADPTGGTPLFSISKSENRNQVRYAIRLDSSCAPVGDAPVYAYWRMLEKGETSTEPLTHREVAAFGVQSQTVVQRSAHGGTVRLSLRGFPGRPILVEVAGQGGACRATSTMAIDGQPAFLFDAYAKLKWPFGVDYVLLSGWAPDGSHIVRERMHP